MDREAEEIFGDWTPPQVRGIMQLSVIASADVAGVRVYKKVSSRRIFSMEMGPCPDILAEVMGTGMGSMIHANPVALMRRVRSWRGPIPADGEEIPDPNEPIPSRTTAPDEARPTPDEAHPSPGTGSPVSEPYYYPDEETSDD